MVPFYGRGSTASRLVPLRGGSLFFTTKNPGHFLKKLRDLPDFPEKSIICPIDVVGLYPSILYEEGLRFLRNLLQKRSNKSVSTDTLFELAGSVLQNNYFEFNERYFEQIRGTAI